VADLVRGAGGDIHFASRIDKIRVEGDRVVSVEGVNQAGERAAFAGAYFFSDHAGFAI